MNKAITSSGSSTAASGLRHLTDGTPVKTLVRMIGTIGKKYAKKIKNEIQANYLDLDREQANHWLETWASMKSDGMSVKITKNHANPDLAESCFGDALDIFENDGRLFCLHEVRGEENIKLAEANREVSLHTRPEVVSPKGGKTYKDAIVAVSYVGRPLVTHQPSDAQAILAGLDEFVETTASIGESDMKLLSGIAKMCGMNETEINEDNALEHLGKYIEKMKTAQKKEEKQASLTAGLNVKYGAKTIGQLDRTKFSTAKIEKLTKLLVSDDGSKPSEIMASLDAQCGDKTLDVLEGIVACLNEDDGGPVGKGGKTEVQAGLEDGNKSPKDKNPWGIKRD